MKIYNYHPITGQFLSEGLASVDPLETANKRVSAAQQFMKDKPSPTPAVAPEDADEATVERINKANEATINAWKMEYDSVLAAVEPEYLLPAYATTEAPPFANANGQVPVFSNGTWTLVDAPKEDAGPKEDAEAEAIAKRNALLCDSDWTQLADAPLTPAKVDEWKAYRKALRDLTDQKGFPNKINWPTKPSK